MRVAIGFYHLAVDQAALCEFLLSTGPVCARNSRAVPDPQEPEFGSLENVLTSDGGLFLICRQCDIADLQIERYEMQGMWWRAVNPQTAPVLTYSYEPLNNRELYRSSLGALLDYVEEGQRRQKDIGFKRWAKSVVGWVRSRCTETCTLYGFDYPCTPAVAGKLKKGELVLKN